MPIFNNEIFFAVIIVSVVFVLLVLLISVLVFLHRNKVKNMNIEKQILKAQFEQTLLRSQIEMQEQTFNIISQEIHDNVGQVLSLAKVQLNIIDQGENINKDSLREVKENVGKAIVDLRDIAKSLNNDRTQTFELKRLIEEELNRINRSGILRTDLCVEGDYKEIDPSKKLILFRIIQESLQNVIKHAQATYIKIYLEYGEDQLEVRINDNGKGFDINQIGEKGLGLQNITSRAKLINGVAEIKSITGNGTTIKISIPYV